MDSATIITAALKDLDAQAGTQKECRDYFDGEHGSAFLSDKFETNWGKPTAGINDNLIPLIVSATVNEMAIVGFAPNDPADKAAAGEAWNAWQRSRMDQRLAEVLEDAGIDDYAGLIAWVDAKGRARIYPQKAGNFWCKPSEENPGEMLSAVKRYRTDDGKHAIELLLPDAIEYHEAPNAATFGRGNPDPADYKLVDARPNPLGVVPARIIGPRLGEVKKVLPLQKLLNRALRLGAAAGEGSAWDTPIVIGAPARFDDEGRQVPWIKPGPGMGAELPSKADGEAQDVSVTFMPGQSMTPFREDANDLRSEMARVSSTPAHMMLQTGTFPSGASLKTARAGFTGKVGRRKVVVGPACADIAAMCVQLDAYQANPDGGVPDRPGLVAVWKPTELEEPLVIAQAVDTLVQSGVPLNEALVRVAGWSREDADAAMAAADERATLAAERAAASFSSAPLAG